MCHTSARKGILPVLAISAYLLLPAAPCRPDLNLQTSVGFDNAVRIGAWAPATVTIKGTGVTAQSQVQIVVSVPPPTPGTVIYARPVDLHAGAVDEQIPLAYLPQEYIRPDGTRARLVVEGRVAAEQPVPEASVVGPTQPLLVALTRDRSGFAYLHRVDLGLPHWPRTATLSAQFSAGGSNNRASNPCVIAYPAPSTLPVCPEAYSAADCVILGDLPMDALTDAQWASLIQWVRDGGELVVSGVADINRLRDPRISGLLPLIPQDTRQLARLTGLAERYRVSTAFGPATIITGRPKADADVICSQKGIPLVLARREGCGVIVFTSFDLASPAVAAWPGAEDLWREILRLRNPELTASAIVEAEMRWPASPFGRGFGPEGSLHALGDALAGSRATGAPGAGFVGLYLASYILCLVPVNYLLLRKKDRREWAWITAPLVVLAFSIGAYGVGYALRGSSLRVGYATILEGAPGQRSLRALTLATIFSPAPAKYDLGTSDPQTVTQAVSFVLFEIGVRARDLFVDEGPGHGVRGVAIPMWSTRSFSLVSHADLGGVIAAAFIPGVPEGTVRITNNTPHRITNCAVTYRAATVNLGTLDPFTTKQASLRVAPAEPWGRISLGPALEYGAYTNYSRTYQRSSSSQEDQIRQALAIAVAANTAQIDGADPLLFTGWIDGDVTGLKIAPARGVVTGCTLLAIHVPHPAPAVRGDRHIGQLPRARRDPFAAGTLRPLMLRRSHHPASQPGRPR